MAELQISAGASRILLGALRAADILNLVVERLESGVDLCIMLTKISCSLVGPHVPERIRGLLSLTQASEGRHVNARARRTGRTRGSGVSGGTLRDKTEGIFEKIILLFRTDLGCFSLFSQIRYPAVSAHHLIFM